MNSLRVGEQNLVYFYFTPSYAIILPLTIVAQLRIAREGGCLRGLITGISGFVGSHLAEHLLQLGNWTVAGTVYGSGEQSIAHLREKLTLYEAELSALGTVQGIVEDSRPDAIFHLAAQPIPSLSRIDPWYTLENNIRLQVNVLQAITQVAPHAVTLVIGSSEEYGQVAPADLPVTEDAPLRPTSPYAVSKIAQDFLGLQYYLSHGVRAIRMRPFNHIGPRQRRGFVAPDFASQIAEIEAGLRPPVMIVGQLDVARDFSDVRDIVRGYVLAANARCPARSTTSARARRTASASCSTLLRHAPRADRGAPGPAAHAAGGHADDRRRLLEAARTRRGGSRRSRSSRRSRTCSTTGEASGAVRANATT